MSPRERVLAALQFRAPDVIPLRCSPSAGGLYEHGQKLVDLYRACGHDFGDLSDLRLPDPPLPEDYDPDGSYHAYRTDAWGTRWEYRIFGIWGHPVEWPLEDMTALDNYQVPAPPPASGPEVEAARAAVAQQKQTYYTLGGGGSIFETMRSLRRFEDVLADIALDTPQINRLADMIADYCRGCIEHALALDVDGVCFGDDHGTQEALIVSPATFRRFFKPRYAELFAPVHQAGKQLLFHVCGQVEAILDDFAEVGVNVIWPQVTAFDMPTLARRCRELGMVVELHPDRGELMQRSTPAQVRDYVLRMLDIFGTADGGSWLYIEIDPGFPWENVEALFEVAMELRS